MYSVITVEWNPFVSIIFYVLAKHFENYLMLNISHMYIHIYIHTVYLNWPCAFPQDLNLTAPCPQHHLRPLVLYPSCSPCPIHNCLLQTIWCQCYSIVFKHQHFSHFQLLFWLSDLRLLFVGNLSWTLNWWMGGQGNYNLQLPTLVCRICVPCLNENPLTNVLPWISHFANPAVLLQIELLKWHE
jgi:hypothetical protein